MEQMELRLSLSYKVKTQKFRTNEYFRKELRRWEK